MHESTHRQTRVSRVAAAALIAGFAIAGCAADSGAQSQAAGGGTTIDVTLQEWSVTPSAASAPAGDVTFAITNDGPDDIHEFVVLKTDLDPGDLPTDDHGAVSEDGEGIEVVDEIEEVPVGETKELTVTLEAGNYVLLCNIYDEDEDEAHYQMGMRTAFEVTE
jgi:iron uptake system component EfeO